MYSDRLLSKNVLTECRPQKFQNMCEEALPAIDIDLCFYLSYTQQKKSIIAMWQR